MEPNMNSNGLDSVDKCYTQEAQQAESYIPITADCKRSLFAKNLLINLQKQIRVRTLYRTKGLGEMILKLWTNRKKRIK
jgi:hypothetical protein